MRSAAFVAFLALAIGGCKCGNPTGPGDSGTTDSGRPADAGVSIDAGRDDGGGQDAGRDSGVIVSDGGCPDAVITNVVTYHNDPARTGQYLTETCLKPSNVGFNTFGLLFTLPVDGKVDAQPLYVAGVNVAGKGTHNVLYVATEHDTVYAFDADSNTGVNASPLWQVSMLASGETPSDSRACNQVTPEIGVTATPVIDTGTGTLYLVAMSKTNGSPAQYIHRLHALDLGSGADRIPPVVIQAQYPGTGANSSNGIVVFDPAMYKERPGMLLQNGVVYTAWSSHCDHDPYTAFVMSYDAATLRQKAVVDAVPNGTRGAFWMAGAGIAADPAGNLVLLSGNGTFDTTLDAKGFPNKQDFGNAFVKISNAPDGGLEVSDYFTMSGTVGETNIDQDLGSGGVMLLPDAAGSAAHPHLAVGAGKDQHIYLVDEDAMGGFSPTANNIVQDLTGVLGGSCFSIPGYYDGAIYYGAVNDALKRIPIANARMAAVTSQSTHHFGGAGTFPSFSADSATSANGIVWAVDSTQGTNATLFAYLASDLTQKLYDSTQAPAGRDSFGSGNKYMVPTIANSKVYVGTTDRVGVFGLR